VLYEYERLPLALREGHMLGVSENRMLRRTFDPERKKKQENFMKRSFIIPTDYGILQVLPNQGR
jgi:hypothetical protein